jgi:asparagine N-glycosylation enzyme membrane subunit Stt3
MLASGSGLGALLVSPFNVKWRCYVWGGGVEEPKFFLFLVVFPVICISSISPRFYYRKHAFCFLPVAAILESLLKFL